MKKKNKNIFVKVGVTTKKHVQKRFSKEYGYDGYSIKKILRKYKTTNKEALKIEKLILDKLKNKNTVQKYRPILENFSGYSECFSILSLNEIINIFDEITKN